MPEPTTSRPTAESGHVQAAVFDTAGIAREDRYEAWRQFIGVTHDVEAVDAAARSGNFRGRVNSTAIDRMVVRVMDADPQSVYRSSQRCRRDDLDHVTLHLTTSAFDVEAPSGSFHVPAGAITVNTLAQPFRRSAAPERGALIVSLARDLLSEHVPDPEALHGTVLHGTGAAAIFSAHMAALCRHMWEVRASQAPTLATATAQLFAAALPSTRETREAARPVAQAAALVRCRGYVARHLRSPDLSADSLCRNVGISRSVLYRLFQPSGGIAHYIRKQRLLAVHDALLRSPARLNIAALAYSYGFSNIPAFNRLFRSTFGASPSEVWRLEADTRQVLPVPHDWLHTLRPR